MVIVLSVLRISSKSLVLSTVIGTTCGLTDDALSNTCWGEFSVMRPKPFDGRCQSPLAGLEAFELRLSGRLQNCTEPADPSFDC